MSTYHNLIFHIIFSTKERRPVITADIEARLHDYIGGIIRNENGVPYKIGGVADHVHVLLRWRADDSISNLVRTIKSNSTGWIHRTFPDMNAFEWQAGYACFSVSQSQCEKVKEYISNQHDHHHKETFQQELIRFLEANEVNYDPRYILA